MKKNHFSFIYLFLACVCSVLVFLACSSDNNDELASNIDDRFVGTWVRDESISGVVEQVYTLTLDSDGSASYSWYRHSNTIGHTGHESNGIWYYDKNLNRIITDCTTSATGSTVILDVVSVTSTTLVVKQEGSSKSKTYNKR